MSEHLGPRPPRETRSRRRLALSVAGALAIIAVIVAIVVVSGSDDGEQVGDRATASPSTTPDDNAFTGTFVAAFGPALAIDGSPGSTQPTDFTDTFRIRAACVTDGCAATASTDGKYASKDLVFDNVGGTWVAVTTTRRACGSQADDEAWNVLSVRLEPDRTLTGEMTQTTAQGCFNKRTLRLTRTGDTDVSLLPDPAAEPARIVSPAEGFRGRYRVVVTYADGGFREDDNVVHTDCLRRGDRCASHMSVPGTQQQATYVFADGGWTRNDRFETDCSVAGGTSQIVWTSTLDLPQPVQNPIPRLTGRGYSDSTGSACRSQSFDERFTRIGD